MGKKTQLEVGGRVLQVSNLDKVLYPENQFRKGDVINYYVQMADYILPHLKNRPLTLKRYPEGVNHEHFYEKDAPSHKPDWVKTTAVARRGGGSDINFVLINDLPSLVWAANLASLEMHVFLARAGQIDRPDFFVVDLDPGEPANVLQAAEVGLRVRDVFQKLGMKSFLKSSGSKGCQLYVPLNTKISYADTEPFAKALAELLEQQQPELIVSEMAKDQRVGKVFIDWSQNVDYKTTVCVYSLRGKRMRPFVSMPLEWKEVERAVSKGDADAFTFEPEQALKRVQKLGDLFAPVLTLKQKLPKIEELQGAMKKPVAKAKRTAKPAGKKEIPSGDTSHDGSLREYDRKRDFQQTAEPGPEREKSAEAGDLMFVIQKHDASHLHYDFRLEMGGVLKSWAVPKGPPFTPAERRLAMHVEDHPMSYARFEGTIPPGNYGAGTVMVWDIGTYRAVEEKPLAAYHKGKLKIQMAGKKLKGEWTLVRSSRADANGKQPWYLLKTGGAAGEIPAKVLDRSVLTNRTLDEIANDNDAQWQSNRSSKPSGTKPAASRAKRTRASAKADEPDPAAFEVPSAAPAAKPGFVNPMKAKLVAQLPHGPQWSYEIKFDGYRCQAVKNGSSVELLSRNANSFNSDFPEVVRAVGRLPCAKVTLDGEVVAVEPSGKMSFQALQGSSSHSGITIHYYAFDILNLEGRSLLKLPLSERRELLKQVFAGTSDPLLHFSGPLEAEPEELIEAARDKGFEGIIAKRNDSYYEPGDRSGCWVKFKTNQEQEFVIGGWRRTSTAKDFDALYVGLFDDEGRFKYVAKVRGGFTPLSKQRIITAAASHVTREIPFYELKITKVKRNNEGINEDDLKNSVWVKPAVVAQIEFVEWTEGGALRHPRFKGLRVDKEAREVKREVPA
ncbi:MAG TPA: non-homologous end-joining DNA ligase [Methylomirabilota bacterium]|nr:non-homologous end-joining DNA ligase [Methylomirabilota bacterium]